MLWNGFSSNIYTIRESTEWSTSHSINAFPSNASFGECLHCSLLSKNHMVPGRTSPCLKLRKASTTWRWVTCLFDQKWLVTIRNLHLSARWILPDPHLSHVSYFWMFSTKCPSDHWICWSVLIITTHLLHFLDVGELLYSSLLNAEHMVVAQILHWLVVFADVPFKFLFLDTRVFACFHSAYSCHCWFYRSFFFSMGLSTGSQFLLWAITKHPFTFQLYRCKCEAEKFSQVCVSC